MTNQGAKKALDHIGSFGKPGAIIAAVVTAFVTIQSDVASLKDDVNKIASRSEIQAIKDDVKTLKQSEKEIAVISTRLTMIEQTVMNIDNKLDQKADKER